MSDERKYEVLPGVELPDMKTIMDAASDFSASGVNELQIKTPKPIYTPEGEPADRATAAELAALQSLGEEVAEHETRIAEESRKRMSAIMNSAVQAPESLADLINYNKDRMSEEALKEANEKIQQQEALKQAEAEREKAREERRQMQQRLLEEARERAASMREAEKRGIRADKSLLETPEVEEFKTPADSAEAVETVKKEAEPEASKPAAPVQSVKATPSAPEEPSKPAIASDDETYDDFSEFFDDNK